MAERPQTDIAQHRTCPWVTADAVAEKVIEGAARTGRYYWAKNSRNAIEQLGAQRCRQPAAELSSG